MDKESYNPHESTKVFSFSFDDSIDGTHLDSATLPGVFNEKFDTFLERQGLNPQEQQVSDIGYYALELCKNAIEYGGSGTIETHIKDKEIWVLVTTPESRQYDFSNPNHIIEAKPMHGLDQVKQFADQFMIETGGRLFRKIGNDEPLEETEDPDPTGDIRITFVKKLQ